MTRSRRLPGGVRVSVLRRPAALTRRLQPAGVRQHGRPLRWTDGFALWLPGRRLLLVSRHDPYVEPTV